MITLTIMEIADTVLYDREREAFQLLSQWYTLKEIADEMIISIKTVETYVAKLRAAFDCSTLLELRRVAVEYFAAYPYKLRIYEQKVTKTYQPEEKTLLRQKFNIK